MHGSTSLCCSLLFGGYFHAVFFFNHTDILASLPILNPHYAMIHTVLPDGLLVRNAVLADAEALADLQRRIFPTMSEDELIRTEHFYRYIELFQEGQIVIMDGDALIGSTSVMRSRWEDAMKDHTFLEASGNLWWTTHDPDGEWAYGMDMMVDLGYRGRGLARVMYRARQQMCRNLGLKGQITVGMPNGYLPYQNEMTLKEYVAKLMAYEIFDPTVSVQHKMGFQFVRLIENYLEDPQSGNGGVLMYMPVEVEV